MIYVGTAGWALPRQVRDQFPEGGSNLQRYAGIFPAAEINSSFYRQHQPAIYARWADSVPEHFRFSVKLPKAITHTARLVNSEGALDTFLAQASGLGEKLGCLLVQLPPSLKFDAEIGTALFRELRERYSGPVAVEPRSPSWFMDEADALLVEQRIGRVAADPGCVPEASEPGGWSGTVYYRLHGSPRMYFSSYESEYLERLTQQLKTAAADPWCIFDNTTLGAAAANALECLALLSVPAKAQQKA